MKDSFAETMIARNQQETPEEHKAQLKNILAMYQARIDSLESKKQQYIKVLKETQETLDSLA